MAPQGMANPIFSTANRVQLLWGHEPSYAAPYTVPVAGLSQLRFTKETLEHRIATILSNEIVNDRTRRDQGQVGISAVGGFEGEFSADTYDSFLADAFAGTWASDVLVNGSTQPSYLIEKGFLDVGQYFPFTGLEINTFKLTATTGANIIVAVDFLGAQGPPSTNSIVGSGGSAATVSPPTSTVVESAQVGIQALQFAGATVAYAKSLSLEVKNNLRERPSVGRLYSAVHGRGYLELTITADVYFADTGLYNYYVTNGGFPISFTLGSVTGKRYNVVIPNCKVATSPITTDGANTEIVQKITANAFKDPVSGNLIQITRHAA